MAVIRMAVAMAMVHLIDIHGVVVTDHKDDVRSLMCMLLCKPGVSNSKADINGILMHFPSMHK